MRRQLPRANKNLAGGLWRLTLWLLYGLRRNLLVFLITIHFLLSDMLWLFVASG
jgi:hypothetical protein